MASAFDTSQLPTLDEQLADEVARRQIATSLERNRPQSSQGNWFTSAVSSGIDQFQARTGVGIQAFGDRFGNPGNPISQLGAGIAERNFAEAAANSTPELEERPSLENWTQYPKWLGYQAAKQLPNLAASLVAIRLGGGAAASMLPKSVAATTLGRMAAGAIASAPAMYPQAAGSLYKEAIDAGNAGPEAAGQSLMWAFPYSLMEGFQPAALERQLAKGLAGNFLRRVGTAAAVNAATEGVTEGVQTAMEQSFRPDLTPRDKLNNIVEGAISGAAVGGLFGAFGGIRKLKTADPATTSNDTLKQVTDEALKPPAPQVEPDGQMRMEGFEGQTQRPFGAQDKDGNFVVSNEELQARLAEVEQRGLLTSEMGSQIANMAPIARSKQDMTLAQLLRTELDRRMGTAPAEAPAQDFTAGQQTTLTDFPVAGQAPEGGAMVTQGPFRQETTFAPPPAPLPPRQGPMLETADNTQRIMRYGLTNAQSYDYQDIGGQSAEQIAQRVAQEQGPAAADTTRQFEMFAADSAAMPVQTRPTVAGQQDIRQVSDEEAASRKLATQLLGDTKSKVAETLKTMPTKDATDFLANVSTMLNEYASSNTNPPAPLVKLAKRYNLLDQKGVPRDINAELEAAYAQNELMLRRAQETGQGLAQQQAFQKGTLQKLKALKAQSDAIQQRVKERAAAAAAQAEATRQAQLAQAAATTPAPAAVLQAQTRAQAEAAFTAPTAGLKLDVKQDNRAVSDGDTEWLQKQQMNASLQPDGRALNGALTAWTTKPVELPVRALRQLPSVTPTTDSKIDRLVKRVSKVGWKPQPITVKVNHRGEAFVENGNARLIVAQGEGQRTIPVNIEWMNGAEISNTPWSPNNLYQLTQDGQMPPRAEPTSAASPENIARLNEESAMLKRLERIAKSDAVSRELKNKASDAAALMRDFQPGAVDNARQVLQEAKATHVTYAEGEIGPTPVGSEKLAAAAENFKTAEDAARWLLANTKNPLLKVILNKIIPSMEQAPFYLVKAGEPVRGEIAARLNNSRVGAYLSNYTTGERGLFMRADSLTEGLLAHELIHTAINVRLYEGNLVRNKGTELAKLVGEFYDLQKVVAQAYKAMVKAGINPEFTQMTTVQAAASSPYEFTTYAFTDPVVQDFFRAIPYQRQTVWTKFVTLVRELLGLSPKDQNALTAIIDLSEQLLDMPLPSQQSALNAVDKSTVAWTDQRLDAELRDSHYNDGRSKAWVGWVNPVEFLNATDLGAENRAGIEARSKELYPDIRSIARNRQTPYITYDGDRVVGHEGRHRIALLARKGVTSVPVVVTNRDGEVRMPQVNMTFKPQKQGNEFVSQGPVTVRDLIPLHRDYTDAIKERMAKTSVTFSEGGEGYIYIVHGGSDFDQIDLRNSGRGEPGNIRPLGPGLYTYVVDPNMPEEARRAIEGARRYATKYARGDKTLHVFRVPRGVNAGWVGYHNPLPGTQLPADGKYDLRAERLPVALTEVSVLNPAVAERVAKFPLDANVDDVLDAVLADGGPQITYALASPQGLNEATKRLATMADTAKQAFFGNHNWNSLSLEGNRLNLYTSTLSHIAELYGPLFDNNGKNGPRAIVKAHRDLQVTEQRLGHLVKRVLDDYDTLAATDKSAADDVGKLGGYTIFQIDPRKTRSEQTWLKEQRNADVLGKHADEANALYRRHLQIANRPANKGKVTALSVYSDLININEMFHFAQQAMSLYNLMLTDEGVLQDMKDKLANKDPMREFLDAGGAYDAPAASRKYWFDATNELTKIAREYVDQQRGITPQDKTSRAIVNRGTSAIQSRLNSIVTEQAAMARAPYFHIGRFGDYVLRFGIKRGADGKADPAAMERIAKAFDEAGIKNVEFPAGLERANAFLRFEQMGQRDEAFKLAKKLEAEGVVIKPEHQHRRDDHYGGDIENAPVWMSRLMESIETTPIGGNLDLPGVDNKTLMTLKGELKKHVQQFFLNQLPDIAPNKVMVHRNSVPGFSSDMIRSFAFRAMVGGRALANMYASQKMSEGATEMMRVAKEARSSDNPKLAQVKQNVTTEMFKRLAERPGMVKNNWVDTANAFNHAYFLGFSPSHFLVNTTQVGVLLWPELSKKYSFVSSAKAIGKITPLAFKIMKQTMLNAGLKHAPDASITPEVLAAAGVDAATAKFVMRVVYSGLLDIGSQTREIGRLAEGRSDSKTELVLRWASMTGYYSEMLTRLIAALSARELHGDKPGLNDYVDETVRQSMLQYETWNQARATGKMGLAGQMTPIMTSFMKYQFQVTEKLYRELYAAFKGDTPAQRKAARNFLIAHLAAVTTVAGSLGLPGAAIFAGVFDRLKDLFDDDEEPTNIQAAYRDWLANMFGKDMAEVLARGLPRAAGFDISSRAGEQNFLPFGHMLSRLITDRRDWQDKIGEWALDTMGAPTSMVSNIVYGGGQILTGDLLEGAKTMVPNSIKGPFKAFELSDEGYVDGKGNKMPMSPSAWSILMQAMGFTPAKKAEYTEARSTQQLLRSGLGHAATDIRNRLISALQSNDMAAARDVYAEALKFDRANPRYAVLPGLVGSVRSRQREAAIARQQGAPLGTKPEYANRTDWANFGD